MKNIKNMEKEVWKDIPGYVNFYKASNNGRVKSIDRYIKNKGHLMFIKGKILKPSITKNGYLFLGLRKNGRQKNFLVHQLIVMAFLNHKPCGFKKVIDHINNIKTDNRIENLQIVSSRYNSSKNKTNKSSKYTGVSKAGNKWHAYIRNKGKVIFLGSFNNQEEAGHYYLKALHSIKNNLKIHIKKPDFSSNYTGVAWSKLSNKWCSYIDKNGSRVFLGYFKNENDAHEYYLKALESIEKGKKIKVKRHQYSSKYKGVSWFETTKKWKAFVRDNKKSKHLGYFKNEIDAYNAVQEYWKNK